VSVVGGDPASTLRIKLPHQLWLQPPGAEISKKVVSSSADSGVCRNSSRNFLDGFFLRLRILPRSVTTSCSRVTPSIRIEPKGKSFEMHTHLQPLADTTLLPTPRLLGALRGHTFLHPEFEESDVVVRVAHRQCTPAGTQPIGISLVSRLSRSKPLASQCRMW
jgi:hypothetical protein